MGSETAKKVTFIKCDLSDWTRVAAVAKQIASQTDKIDILINNAARGIMTYQLTDYGVDRHMAVNHMGHVILTSHLMPLLKKSAEAGNTARIVMLGSNAHPATPSDCKFASLDELNQDLGPNGQYGRSKLAQMLYARYLTTHLTSKYPKILANCVHPGLVRTKQSKEDIHEAFPLAGYGMSVVVAQFNKDQFMGATSALFCATKTEMSGQYICPPAIPEEGSSQFQDDELMENLMVLTEKVIKEKTKAESVDKGCPFKFV